MIEGKVLQIINHGTIITVDVKTKDNKTETIPFDHRAFIIFYEDNKPLKGKTLQYDPENNTVKVKQQKPKNKRCRMDKRLRFSQAMQLGLCWSCDPSTICTWKEKNNDNEIKN